MNGIGDKMLRAAKAQFFASREAAEAQLTVYLNSPVGVGEHPDLVGEVVKLVKSIDAANGCIDTIDAIASNAATPGEVSTDQ
jgi:methylaspartate ammonia-lyase